MYTDNSANRPPLMGDNHADESLDDMSLDEQFLAAISTMNNEQLDEVIALMQQMLDARTTD